MRFWDLGARLGCSSLAMSPRVAPFVAPLKLGLCVRLMIVLCVIVRLYVIYMMCFSFLVCDCTTLVFEVVR